MLLVPYRRPGERGRITQQGQRVNQVGHAAHGQIVALFALMIMILMGMAGMAIDLTHARTLAEEVQRAADAAALAGVVYLPEAPGATVAETTAAATAAANGYANGGSTQINSVPDSLDRKLKVTITTKVATPFLNVLGRGTITVVRSAVATYGDPISMGAPDHMLGFAPFPTNAFNDVNPSGFYPQGFYLQLKGSYGGIEHGDAFTPYFETNRWSTTCKNSGGATVTGNCAEHLVNKDTTIVKYTDPCTGTDGAASYKDICTDTNSTPGSHTMVLNPYYNQQNGTSGQTGYNFIFELPPNMNHLVLLKVNDPLDECALDTNSTSFTATNSAPVVNTSNPSASRRYEYEGTEVSSAPSGVTVGNSYKDSSGNNHTVNDWQNVFGLLDGQSATGTTLTESTTRVDQCDTMYWDTYRPNTLAFTVYTPALRAAENTQPAATATNANTTTTGQDVNASVTVGYNPIYTGPEWQAAASTDCQTDYSFSVGSGYGKTCFLTGAHAFNWLTLGSAINNGPVPAYIRVSVQSVQNTAYWPNNAQYPGYGSADSGTFATGGNVFSLAVCDIGSAPGAISGTTITETDPASSGALYGDIFNSKDWEPADLTGKNPDKSCPDPNADSLFSTDVSNGLRFQVNGREAMCIMTLSQIPSGSSSVTDFIPLAEVGSHFAGTTITIRLFDAGDMSGADNYISIMGPGDNPSNTAFTSGSAWTSQQYTGAMASYAYPAGSSFKSEPYRLSISSPGTPATHYSDSGIDRPPWWCGKLPSTTDYDADNAPSGNAALCPPTTMNPIDQGVHVADTTYKDPITGGSYTNDFSNDVWLEFHVTLPTTYSPTPEKDWWKVAYNIVGSAGGGSNDTTTWQVVSGSAPVHLVTGE